MFHFKKWMLGIFRQVKWVHLAYNTCDNFIQSLAYGWCVSLGSLTLSTNKIDFHDMSDILLKLLLTLT